MTGKDVHHPDGSHIQREIEKQREGGTLVPHVQVNNSPFLFLSPFTLLFYALGLCSYSASTLQNNFGFYSTIQADSEAKPLSF